MPQMQLPVFPAGVTEINRQIAVQKCGDKRDAPQKDPALAAVVPTVWYLHGHLAVFHHDEDDVQSFRMITSQMIESGTVKQQEIVKTSGVPAITVKRYAKLYRERGPKGFFESKPRHNSASVLKGKVLEQAQQLLDQRRSVPEVSAQLGVLGNTIHKAIRAGRLRADQKKT